MEEKPKKETPKPGHPVWEGMTIGQLASRWGRARDDAERAVGTKDHPRLVAMHEIAGLQYSHMHLFEQFKSLQNQFCEVIGEVGELRRTNAYYESMLQDVMPRLLMLENSHAMLTIRAGQKSFIDDVVKAYEIGKNSKLENQPKKEDNHGNNKA